MNDGMSATAAGDRPVVSGRLLARLEVADGALALVMVAAAIMRLVDLGRLPLSAAEAGAALAPWLLWAPGLEPGPLSSPAYFTITSLMTQLLGFSDGVMRLTPALFGVATVGLPWLLKEQMGRLGALTFALLLAVSPPLSALSRTAGGEAIALFSLLLVFVSWLRYREAEGQRWLMVLFAAGGLGLASAPLFYSGLVTMLVAALAVAAVSPTSDERSGPAWPALPETPLLQRAALTGGLLFIGASTLFLWHPAGLGSAAQLPARWLAQFSFQGGVDNLVSPLLGIGRYELPLIVPGLAAMLWAILRERPLGTLCTYWMIAGVLLLLLQWGQLDNIVLLTLPGYLLLAEFVQELLLPRLEAAGLAVVGVWLVSGAAVFANLARYSRLVAFEPQKLGNIWISFAAVVVLLTSLYLVLTWRPEIAYQGSLAGVLTLLLFYQWGTAWWLSHEAANDPRERWVDQGTDQSVRVLAGVMRDISRQVTGSDHELALANMIDSPVIDWYLRDYTRIKGNITAESGEPTPVILSPAETELALASDYLGADFVLQKSTPRPASGGQSRWQDILKWWLFHDSTAEVNEQRVLLWWRADLVGRLN